MVNVLVNAMMVGILGIQVIIGFAGMEKKNNEFKYKK
jgi:hypothetical protein